MAVKTGDDSDNERKQRDNSNDIKEDLTASEECFQNEKMTDAQRHVFCNEDDNHKLLFIDEKCYNTNTDNDSKEKYWKRYDEENSVLKESTSEYLSVNQALNHKVKYAFEVTVHSNGEFEKNSDEKISTESEPDTNKCVTPECKYMGRRMDIFRDFWKNGYIQMTTLKRASKNRKSTFQINASEPLILPHNCRGDFTTCMAIFCFMMTHLEILQDILMLLTNQITKCVNACQLYRISSEEIQKPYTFSAKKVPEWLTTHHTKKILNVITVYPLGADLRSFMSVTGKTIGKMMENEWIRLSTYVGFPPDCPVSTMRLSDAGFYYPGSGNDEVMCFKCGVKYKGWKQDDIPVLVHKTISPSCQFIQNKSPPTGNEYGPRPQNIQQRRENRIPVTGSGPQEPENIGGARGGPSDTQQIASKLSEVNLRSTATTESSKTGTEKQTSKPVLAGSRSPDTSQKSTAVANPAHFAQSSSSSRTALAQSSSANVSASTVNNESTSAPPASGSISQEPPSSTAPTAIQPAVEPLGVTTIKPKYPNFAVYVTRLQTYKGFPKDLNQKPEDLAKAGFFYEGKNDNVRCFYCGGGLRDWEPEDDVWIEHARWYKKCVYLRQSKGDEFIRLVHSGQYEILRREKEQKKAAEQKKKEVMQLPAVISVIEMGYDTNLVKQAYQKCASEQGDGNVTAEILIQMVWQLEEEGYTNLESENEAASTETERSSHETSGAVSQLQTTSLDLPLSESGEQANAESVEELERENRILKEQQVCKICMEEEAAIVFLPCGHMVTCVACAAALRHCPICRTFIRGTIKAIVC